MTGERAAMEGRMIGIPASPGIVIGSVHLLLWEVPEVPNRIVADEAIPSEIARFHEALVKAKQRLLQVKERAERFTA